MAQGTLPPDPESSNPYARLGISADASFEQVQQAKEQCLNLLTSDDAQGRARVESAYDAVLMQRLKERQLGQLTGAAATASKREAAIGNTAPASPSLVARIPALQSLPRPQFKWQKPSTKLAEGKQLWLPLAGHGVLLLLLLLTANQLGTPELLLAIASLLTIGALQRRRSRLLAAVGLGVGALAVGLLLGTLASSYIAIGSSQVATIPALILLAITAILFD